MSISERRKIKEFQEVFVPEREREVQEICGAAVIFDVDWDSFQGALDIRDGLLYLNGGTCDNINRALRASCKDDLGKEAVRNGLKKITLGRANRQDERVLRFESGTLEIRSVLEAFGCFSSSEIEEELDRGL